MKELVMRFSDGIAAFEITVDGKVKPLYASENVCEFFGYTKEELLPYSTKAAFMNEYMSMNNIKEAYFVDDNSNNLTPCNQYPQIKPLLAGWGNIAINETGLSAEDIVNILC